jgi:hypothetical protein
MISDDIAKEIWEITDKICLLCKNRTINGISTKKLYISDSGKTKWKDKQEICFDFKNEKTFTISYTIHYNDSDYSNSKNKSIVEKITYHLDKNKINGIKDKDILSFITYKLRMVKIEKFIFNA